MSLVPKNFRSSPSPFLVSSLKAPPEVEGLVVCQVWWHCTWSYMGISYLVSVLDYMLQFNDSRLRHKEQEWLPTFNSFGQTRSSFHWNPNLIYRSTAQKKYNHITDISYLGVMKFIVSNYNLSKYYQWLLKPLDLSVLNHIS